MGAGREPEKEQRPARKWLWVWVAPAALVIDRLAHGAFYVTKTWLALRHGG